MASWKQISGGLTRISAGSVSNVWGVNAGGNIFRYTGDDSNPWVQIPGALTDIGAGADGRALQFREPIFNYVAKNSSEGGKNDSGVGGKVLDISGVGVGCPSTSRPSFRPWLPATSS
ncbi:hypothetical protein B0H14DRAFT_2586692 [Mycena olivaceomarginata]|nr:hypothetical protein B0H14DRAFT_2612076 [Mycena olivaceomarginata]KAJ7841803.1 hypothetical protein B0H14DRAFT_2586692 [Mycena olivaceomarginata]